MTAHWTARRQACDDGVHVAAWDVATGDTTCIYCHHHENAPDTVGRTASPNLNVRPPASRQRTARAAGMRPRPVGAANPATAPRRAVAGIFATFMVLVALVAALVSAISGYGTDLAIDLATIGLVFAVAGCLASWSNNETDMM